MGGVTVADAASAYARAGWRVVVLHGIRDGRCTCRSGGECPTPGKHPRWSGWQKMATSDPAVIAGLLRGVGEPANIGLRLVDTGVAVVDVDSPAGAADLRRLVGDALDRAPRATTRRGDHYYVATDAPAGALLTGVELKVENLIVPPSVNPDGTVRAWACGLSLLETTAPDLPDALAALRRPRAARMLPPAGPLGAYEATRAGADSLSRICEWMSKRGRGERHPALLWAAVELLDVVVAGHLRQDAAQRVLRRAAEVAWEAELAAEGPDGATSQEIDDCLNWASAKRTAL